MVAGLELPGWRDRPAERGYLMTVGVQSGAHQRVMDSAVLPLRNGLLSDLNRRSRVVVAKMAVALSTSLQSIVL
jgi:hypothetical protein